MSYHREEFVRSRVRALAWLLRRENEDNDEGAGTQESAVQATPPLTEQRVDQLVRLLRPTTSIGSFANAVKIRLRQSIINNPHVSASDSATSAADGPLLLARFDQECETLRRANPTVLQPFLVLLKPLSFYEPPLSSQRQRERQRRKQARDGRPPTTALHSQNVITTNDKLSAEIPMDFAKKHNPLLSKEIQDDSAIHIGFPTRDATKSAPREDEAVRVALSAEQVATHWISPQVEKQLLVDLVYVLQGVTGKHIKFDTRSESYVIDPALQLHSTARDLILCICELGWLFTRTQNYLKLIFPTTHSTHDNTHTSTHTTVSSSSVNNTFTNKGLVIQAFGCALQEELQDYYRLLAVLEQELLKKDEQPQDVNSGLTLLRLKAWMQEPIERMCMMARLVDCAGSLVGGALASRLHAHSRHGDAANTQLVQRIMDSVCVPIYANLTRWLLHGELHDPHNEFFIGTCVSPSKRNTQLTWRESYFLRTHLLPSFIPRALAEKMLLIGKSINFFKLCLQRLPKDARGGDSERDRESAVAVKPSMRQRDKAKRLTTYGRVVDVIAGETKEIVTAQWESDEEQENDDESKTNIQRKSEKPKVHTVLDDVLSTCSHDTLTLALQGLRYGGELRLSDLVLSLSSSIDSHLLSLLQTRFHIHTHLLALKKFMLLGQGDFVTVLMDGVGPELKKRANQLFRHNLTSILEGALRSSNAQYEPNFVLDRVSVRLLEPTPGDSGWEVFSLDYAMEMPLNAIVDSEAMAKYRIAFHMLWRLKRVEWSLASTWKQFMAFAHTHDAQRTRGQGGLPGLGFSFAVAGLQDLRGAFHRCHLNRARMMHVINNLCAYLMFEVLETAWVHLEERLDKAKCLDDVIAAHDAYLNEILDRALLSSHHEVLNIQLQQLLQIILRFCHLEETLVADATAYIARQKLSANQRTSDVDDTMSVGSTHTDRTRFTGLSSAHDMSQSVPMHIISRIDETVKEYSAQFDKLMDMLKDESDKSAEVLRFLTFRLDFNDYHENQRQKGKGVGITGTPKAVAAPLALTYGVDIEPRKLNL